MENSIQFDKKPFHGVFAEAAKRLKLHGKNARTLARNSYRSGNRKAVKVVHDLIQQRIAEQEANRAIVKKAVTIQSQEAEQ